MRVLLVHNRYRKVSPGGENRMVDQEHQALTAAGHFVEAFERSSDEIEHLPVRRKALLPIQLVRNPATRRQLQAALEGFRPDVVHIHNLLPLLSPSVLSICRDHGVPCVATFHNYGQICGGCTLYRTGSECRACVGRRLPIPAVRHGCYRHSVLATTPMAVSTVVNRSSWRQVPAAYIFISDAQRKELEPVGFPAERCFVKYNFCPDPGRRARPDGTVSFLGRLTENKGLGVLMRAWEHYIRTGPTGLRLVIAGSGPLERRVRAWADQWPSVRFAGHLSADAAGDLVARSSAVVVPSEWPEPFGLVVAEAMAAGVAPIASERGAFPELITDGVDGLLYPPGNHVALATLLRKVEEAPQWHAALGAVARQTYERRFSPAASIERLEQIYRYALANPRTGFHPRHAEAPPVPVRGADAAGASEGPPTARKTTKSL